MIPLLTCVACVFMMVSGSVNTFCFITYLVSEVLRHNFNNNKEIKLCKIYMFKVYCLNKGKQLVFEHVLNI